MTPNFNSGPALHAWAVTPNDSAALPNGPARALFIGTGGVVVLDTVGGETQVSFTVPSGFLLPMQVNKVWNTNTTASNMVALA